MLDFGVTEKKADELRRRMESCEVREADLEEKFVRSSGPGGQKVNKTASCVYLKHPPSGQTVKMQKSRSLSLNRFYARRRLCELIEAETLGKAGPEEKKRETIRKQKQRRQRRNQAKKVKVKQE